jgi:hypothetical protein
MINAIIDEFDRCRLLINVANKIITAMTLIIKKSFLKSQKL